jgi:hypothetical protein
VKEDASPNEIIAAHQRRVEEMDEGEIELAPHEDALEFWDKIMRSTRQPMQRRMAAAKERAQYRYPKLGVVGTTNMSTDDFASMLDRAIARSQTQMRVIEHQPSSPAPIPPHGHVRTGPVPDRRFRRS